MTPSKIEFCLLGGIFKAILSSFLGLLEKFLILAEEGIRAFAMSYY